MRLNVYLILLLYFVTASGEEFQHTDATAEASPNAPRKVEKGSPWQNKPKARAGVLLARYVPQNKLAQGEILPFANVTYRIVGADMNMAQIRSKYDNFEATFKKLYAGANLHSELIHVRPAEVPKGSVERPCKGALDACCLHKGPVADPETWSAVDVTLKISCSRESLWPEQGSVDWAHSRMLGTHLHSIGITGRCLLQRADVLPQGVHAHKYLPITALYTEETTVQFTGNSLSRWLPVDSATQNLILHSMDLIGLNRVAGCARIRITAVSQTCNWVPGRGQIGVANVTFVTHREYPETTISMAFKKLFHILLERLNEEGLNLAKIEVVANRIVRGAEWGNMHDQIASMLEADDPVTVYETRVPDEQLPNFVRPPAGWLGLKGLAAAATVAAMAGGLAALRRKLQVRRIRATKPETVPLDALNEPEFDWAPRAGTPVFARPFPRRDSAPAAALREGLERSLPQLRHARSQLPAGQRLESRPQGLSPIEVLMMQSSEMHSQDLGSFLQRMQAVNEDSEKASSSREDGERLAESSHLHSGTWPDLPDAPPPNPFLASSELFSSSRGQSFKTVPAATVILQGSLQDTATEKERQEQDLKTRQNRERGAHLEEQLGRSSWLLDEKEIEICLKEDGKRWLLGAGAYGKVYRGLRGGVQDVAVKVLHTPDYTQIQQFWMEIKLQKSLSFDRNIVQFLGVCLHSGNPMLVLEFMEGGDLRQALTSSPEIYRWKNWGCRVAIDIVRGLQFLHIHKVVHSDLKSRNVLLGRDRITAKLSDVGMSRILSGSRLSPLPGEIPGTFPYAAPELLLNQTCTTKADIFSLGVLLWEICTSEIPVRGGMRALRPEDCPDEVRRLIDECLNPTADERPTALQVFQSICRCSPHMHVISSLTTTSGAPHASQPLSQADTLSSPPYSP